MFADPNPAGSPSSRSRPSPAASALRTPRTTPAAPCCSSRPRAPSSASSPRRPSCPTGPWAGRPCRSLPGQTAFFFLFLASTIWHQQLGAKDSYCILRGKQAHVMGKWVDVIGKICRLQHRVDFFRSEPRGEIDHPLLAGLALAFSWVWRIVGRWTRLDRRVGSLWYW